MSEYGKCLGYSSEPCPNCGRVRLERYENGKEVCEKCSWCPQESRYVDSEEIYPPGTTMDDKYPYKVYRDGTCVLEATESCRYPKETERSLLDAGYTIKLHGKKITKKEVNSCSRK